MGASWLVAWFDRSLVGPGCSTLPSSSLCDDGFHLVDGLSFGFGVFVFLGFEDVLQALLFCSQFLKPGFRCVELAFEAASSLSVFSLGTALLVCVLALGVEACGSHEDFAAEVVDVGKVDAFAREQEFAHLVGVAGSAGLHDGEGAVAFASDDAVVQRDPGVGEGRCVADRLVGAVDTVLEERCEDGGDAVGAGGGEDLFDAQVGVVAFGRLEQGGDGVDDEDFRLHVVDEVLECQDVSSATDVQAGTAWKVRVWLST